MRFVSYEPALGPLDDLDLSGIDWVIYGGESGPGHRQHDLAWPRVMREKCAEAGAVFFYKQSPGFRTEMGKELDGELVQNFPEPDLRRVLRPSSRKRRQGQSIEAWIVRRNLPELTDERRPLKHRVSSGVSRGEWSRGVQISVGSCALGAWWSRACKRNLANRF